MITGIFTIIGVVLGFYLAKYQGINKKAGELTKEVMALRKKVKEPGYAEDMVVSTDEAALEQAQIAKAEVEEKIDIKDILKAQKAKK